jgi:hypothetical protein
LPRWIPIDRDDLAQERALAELEGRCPKQAQRAYIRGEHHFYDIIAPIWDETQPCEVPLEPLRPQRSAESIERRRAYTREWWRRNGAAYRKSRREAPATSIGTRLTRIAMSPESLNPEEVA